MKNTSLTDSPQNTRTTPTNALSRKTEGYFAKRYLKIVIVKNPNQLVGKSTFVADFIQKLTAKKG